MIKQGSNNGDFKELENTPDPRRTARGLWWSELESTDLVEFRDHLRASGCPESLVRDLVGSRLQGMAAIKERAILGPRRRPEYWQRDLPARPTRDQLAQLKAVASERDAESRRILGVPWKAQVWEALIQVQVDPKIATLAWLPEDKRQAVATWYENQVPAETDSRGETEGQDAFEEQCRRLSTILSLEELSEFRLRNSPTLQGHSLYLKHLSPSREELVALEPLLSRVSINEAVRQAWTPGRVAEFERKSDILWTRAMDATERYQLSPETPDRAVQIKADAELQAAELQKNKALSEEERKLALQKLGVRAENEIRQLVGENGMDYLKNVNSWLINLRSGYSPRP